MERKKEIAIVVLAVIAFGLFLGSMYIKGSLITKEELTFKEEYENLNGKKTGIENKTYKELTLPKRNHVTYSNSDEVIKLLDDGTGIIYFGFPECPWCRAVLPVLMEAMDQTEYDQLYYANIKEERDSKKLDEKGEIITEKKGTKNYQKILTKLDSYLSPYEGLEDETIKRLYFPTLLFVKEGDIVGYHEGTITSQTDPYQELTSKEKSTLLNELILNIKKVQGLICSDDTKC